MLNNISELQKTHQDTNIMDVGIQFKECLITFQHVQLKHHSHWTLPKSSCGYNFIQT